MSSDWCEVDDPFGSLFRDAAEPTDSGSAVPASVLAGAWEVYRNVRPIEVPLWQASHGLKLFRVGTAEHLLIQEALAAAASIDADLRGADSVELPAVVVQAIWDDVESGLLEHAPDWWLADA